MERSTTRKRGCAEISWFILISIIHPKSLLKLFSAQFCDLNYKFPGCLSYFGGSSIDEEFPRLLRVAFYRVHTRILKKNQPDRSKLSFMV